MKIEGFRSIPNLLLIAATVLLGIACLSAAGCCVKRNPESSEISGDAPVSAVEKPSISDPEPENKLKQDEKPEEYDISSKKQEEVNSSLEQAHRMIRDDNLESALRIVERIYLNYPDDPEITMQTHYMKAMIFHRMKDPSKRKQAMDEMLKSMEKLQQDARYRKSYEIGRECEEVVKMSIEKYGKNYEN